VWPACSSGGPSPFREGLLIWPWTFFLFTWSAAAYGPCFTLLITWITEKVTRKKLVKDNVIESAGQNLRLDDLSPTSSPRSSIQPTGPISRHRPWARPWPILYRQRLLRLLDPFCRDRLCGVMPAIILISPPLRKNPTAGNRLHPGVSSASPSTAGSWCSRSWPCPVCPLTPGPVLPQLAGSGHHHPAGGLRHHPDHDFLPLPADLSPGG
jgi:hypothetical protein